jgi:hypothetical protein
MELVEMGLDEINVGHRVRAKMGDLTTLEHSISRLGLLFPVVVNHKNELLSGGRRIEACKNLGMEKVAVLRMEVDADSVKLLEIQCDENLCRKPLTAQELENEIELKKAFLQKAMQEEPSSFMAKFWHLGARLAGRRNRKL